MVEVICGIRSPLFHVVISYSSNKFRCVSWQLKSVNINDVNNGLQLLCIAILSAHISENIDCMYSVVRGFYIFPKVPLLEITTPNKTQCLKYALVS